MSETVRIDLHCHSSISDGTLPPEDVAAALAGAGVQYAALTDHNSTGGSDAFRQAATRLGIGCITGIELTVFLDQTELHLLGYGFLPDKSELQAVLPDISTQHNAVGPNFVAQRKLTAAEGITLLHKAGGIAVFAHPLITEPDIENCSRIIEQLHQLGLDGIEVYRPDQSSVQQQLLEQRAKQYGLLQTAGTDCHFIKSSALPASGINVPRAIWKEFREAVFAASNNQKNTAIDDQTHFPRTGIRSHGHSFATHIVLPAVAALSLFAGVLLFAVLPTFETALLERKREMIRELTNVAWSILAEADGAEKRGALFGADARMQAIKRIEAMRYGREGKDYFWIQDTLPHMIMHPYRKDLNGTDLSGFSDPNGVPIFVRFAQLVKDKNEGYVHYVWQWKDDPTRLEPKESYIRLFEPWGWIIGTGLYTHDVSEELGRLKLRLALFSAAIFVLITLLLVYVIRSSLLVERKRMSAEELLHETTNRYKTLVDAATEGMLVIGDGRCRYGNPLFLELSGYSRNELELLEVIDILPEIGENATVYALINSPDEKISNGSAHGVVQRRNGTLVECTITLQQTGAVSANGYLLLLRRVTMSAPAPIPGYGALGKLMHLPASIGGDLRDEIRNAAASAEISMHCRKTPALVRSLLDNGAYAPDIARMLSLIADAATIRLIDLGQMEFGRAPVPFTYLALGSQGRMEQTLFTDQDSAIMYTPVSGVDQQFVIDYFLKLADFVCDGLANSGYRSCNGKVMANNPRWCQPLPVWKEYFDSWILRADVQELMEFSIFFDFRAVYGEDASVQELRSHVLGRVAASPRFFAQVAQNALQIKPPLRLFGMVVSSPVRGDDAHHIDLKSVTMPIVSFARLYALQQGIVETGSGTRIDELVLRGVLLPSKREDIMTAYALLLRLRLQQQSLKMQQGVQADNKVDPSTLGHIEEAILKECFTEIDLLQRRIRIDFLGGA